MNKVTHNPIHSLPCPICKSMNSVSRANMRIRCNKCNTRLLSIKVKRNVHKVCTK